MSNQPTPGASSRSKSRSRKSGNRRPKEAGPSSPISPIPFNLGHPTLGSRAVRSEQALIRPHAQRPGNVAERVRAASGGLASPRGGVTGGSTTGRAVLIGGHPPENPVPSQLHITQEIAKREEEIEKAMKDIGYLEQARIPFNMSYQGMTYTDAHNDAWEKVTNAKLRIHELEQQRQRVSISLRPAERSRSAPGGSGVSGSRRDTPGAGPSTWVAPGSDTPGASPSARELVQKWTAMK
jgi:hypothetical protein